MSLSSWSWAGALDPNLPPLPGLEEEGEGGGPGPRGWHPGLHECRPCRGSVLLVWTDRRNELSPQECRVGLESMALEKSVELILE
jgi:hypothetical protein